MPRRPDSHVVADLALNRVANICSECGWACETVHKDYGDDLLVQTNHFGLVDYNKIWIQVKGTRDISKMLSQKSGYSISVSLDHAFKWARSMDLVVVVLWDVEKDFGLWTLPKDGLDEWNWRNQKSQKIKLLFNKNSLFDAKQAKMIAWLARIDHYAALVSKARDRDVAYLSDDSIKSQGQHKSWTPLIAYDFLKLLFVLGNESVDSAFVESIKKMEGKLMDRKVSPSQDDKKYTATILAVLVRLHSMSGGCGSPYTLLNACSDVAYAFVQAIENKKIGLRLKRLTTDNQFKA